MKCFKSLNDFVCIYLGEGRRGALINASLCVGTHSQTLKQNRLTAKFGMDKTLMAPHMCKAFRPVPSGGLFKAGQK